MTALCGGGASRPQTGVQTTVSLSAIAVEAFVTSLGFPEIAPLVASVVAAAITIDSAVYCANDPPADPVLTAGDVADALNVFEPIVSLPAQARVAQWFLHRYWWQICECSAVSTPAATAPSNPGAISRSPGLPSGTNPICFQGGVTDNLGHPVSPNLVVHDLTPALLSCGAQINGNNAQAGAIVIPFAVPAYAIPASATRIDMVSDPVSWDPGVGAGSRAAANINFFDAAGNWLSGQLVAQTGPSQHRTTTFLRNTLPWGAAATHYAVCSGVQGAVGSTGVDWIQTINAVTQCGGVALQSGCCPPDPTLEAKLNAIFGLVKAIYEGLPTSPHSYAEATVHAGLTGNGSILFHDNAIAVKVAITGDTTGFRISVGDPSYYWSRGYIVPITAEAPVRRPVRLVYNPQQYELPALTDSIGYTLPPGLTISITELVAGP